MAQSQTVLLCVFVYFLKNSSCFIPFFPEGILLAPGGGGCPFLNVLSRDHPMSTRVALDECRTAFSWRQLSCHARVGVAFHKGMCSFFLF